jgi:hypothetical protein
MVRGKNRLPHNLYLAPEGHLRKYCGIFYATAFTPKELWCP